MTLTIPPEQAGLRLDQALAALLPDYSRSRLKAWIESGEILVDGMPRRPKDKVLGGESIELAATLPEDTRAEAQPIPLVLVHEDRHVFVVDKPAGLVVHPGAGNPDSTLQNALLALDPKLAALPRAGIVHRLDKDTSGLLVVAVDLTLAAEAPYPACVQDANHAVRWLKANATRWNGDVSRLGVYGSSSGGHVAELLAMRPHDPRYCADMADAKRYSRCRCI